MWYFRRIACLWLVLCSASVAEEASHFLLGGSGEVRLKRDGWTSYVPVGFGTVLRSDDLLRVQGTVPVLCADLSVRSVSGIASTPCSGEGSLEYRDRRVVVQRSATPTQIPYMQYPRNTLLLDGRPTLQWHDTGANSYTAEIMGGSGAVLWKRTVEGNRLEYPEDAPPMQPRIDYLAIVTDNDTGFSSTGDPAKGLGFQLITLEGLETLQDARDQIQSLGSLEADAHQFALSVVYAGAQVSESGFRPLGEAWMTLRDLADRRNTPAVYLWLGDLLVEMKLPNEAKDAYEHAVLVAGKLGHTEGEAKGHAALWRLTGDPTHRESAMEQYERLGDIRQHEEFRAEPGQRE